MDKQSETLAKPALQRATTGLAVPRLDLTSVNGSTEEKEKVKSDRIYGSKRKFVKGNKLHPRIIIPHKEKIILFSRPHDSTDDDENSFGLPDPTDKKAVEKYTAALRTVTKESYQVVAVALTQSPKNTPNNNSEPVSVAQVATAADTFSAAALPNGNPPEQPLLPKESQSGCCKGCVIT